MQDLQFVAGRKQILEVPLQCRFEFQRTPLAVRRHSRDAGFRFPYERSGSAPAAERHADTQDHRDVVGRGQVAQPGGQFDVRTLAGQGDAPLGMSHDHLCGNAAHRRTLGQPTTQDLPGGHIRHRVKIAVGLREARVRRTP